MREIKIFKFISKWIFLLLLFSSFHFVLYADEKVVLKAATLAPSASVWFELLQDTVKGIYEKTQGRVRIIVYPGGVMGDEEEVIRKMRIGQLHIGAFTISGIKKIAPELGVLDLPFLFKNYDEVDLILNKFRDEFSRYFEKRGFKILTFSEHGFVYFFSKKDISGFGDLGKTRFWGWKGEKTIIKIIKLLGTSPIYVSVPDLLSALETGMVESFQTTPLSCLSLQWCKLVKTVLDFPYRYEPGVLIISLSAWKNIPSDLRKIILQVIDEEIQKYGGNINTKIRKAQEEAKEKLKQMGIKFVKPKDVKWFESRVRENLWFAQDSDYPHELLEKILAELGRK